MPLWDKVKQELDRAGKVAQEALDEGRIRLEAFRARQMADKTAEQLGYAVHRARAAGAGADQTEVERLHETLAAHEAEAAHLEEQLAIITRRSPRPAGEEGATAPVATGVATVETPVSDFGGNSGASHQPDGSVYTGGAETGSATGGTGTSGTGASSGTAGHEPGAPPGERNEWNREHL